MTDNAIETLPQEEQDDILDTVAHHALGEHMILRQHDEISPDDIENFMLDNGYEKCPGCDWYMESYTFVDEDDVLQEVCEDCREE